MGIQCTTFSHEYPIVTSEIVTKRRIDRSGITFTLENISLGKIDKKLLISEINK